MKKDNVNAELLKFIGDSPSVFHTVKSIRKILDASGFEYLREGAHWKLKNGKYYTVRNDSSIAAFEIPEKIKDYHFQLCASHGDSPTWKLKANPELEGSDGYLKIDTEGYGGMIDGTWLDKPLSVAGRVLIRDKKSIKSKLVYIDKDILIIPNVCIHLRPEINSGYSYNRASDLYPLFSAGDLKKGDFNEMIAKELGIESADIVSQDLFLVNRQEGRAWGYAGEFISSPRLDDLQAAFASLKGFVSSKNPGCISMYVCFDNEEVGSGTEQGAMSTFLKDTIERINSSLGKTEEDLRVALAGSFMVSFDNAHAVHPNHPELSDAANRCLMNRGLVIKENAAQKYTTDALSRAVFKTVCERAGVPVQTFANRSDLRGGSTLGNLSNIQISLHSVDIGIAQLAMHSSYETAGSKDTEYAIKAMREFFSSDIKVNESEEISIGC